MSSSRPQPGKQPATPSLTDAQLDAVSKALNTSSVLDQLRDDLTRAVVSDPDWIYRKYSESLYIPKAPALTVTHVDGLVETIPLHPACPDHAIDVRGLFTDCTDHEVRWRRLDGVATYSHTQDGRLVICRIQELDDIKPELARWLDDIHGNVRLEVVDDRETEPEPPVWAAVWNPPYTVPTGNTINFPIISSLAPMTGTTGNGITLSNVKIPGIELQSPMPSDLPDSAWWLRMTPQPPLPGGIQMTADSREYEVGDVIQIGDTEVQVVATSPGRWLDVRPVGRA